MTKREFIRLCRINDACGPGLAWCESRKGNLKQLLQEMVYLRPEWAEWAFVHLLSFERGDLKYIANSYGISYKLCFKYATVLAYHLNLHGYLEEALINAFCDE